MASRLGAIAVPRAGAHRCARCGMEVTGHRTNKSGFHLCRDCSPYRNDYAR